MDLKELFNNIGAPDNLKEILTEEAKKDILVYLDAKVYPNFEELMTNISKELVEQAKDETGWCKFRDLFFFPVLISVALWMFEKSLLAFKTNTSN